MEERGYKVLLVEDNELDKMAFERMIKEENLSYNYTIVESISKTKEALSSEKFDIVISDYALGDGTAFDVLNLVKDVPVVFVTGTGDEELAVKAWKAGAYDYLIKDLERTYLRALPITVDNAVRHSRMQEILDHKQRNLEAIFDASPVGMLLVDENEVVRRVNEVIKQIFGKDYSKIIGKRFGHALGCINSEKNEDGCGHSFSCSICPLRKSLEKTMNSGQHVHEVEFRPVFKVGDKEIARWFSLSVEPVNIDDDKHVVVALNDITERKQAEDALQASEERYRVIFEQAADSIVLIDIEAGDLVEFNSKTHENLGYSREEFQKLKMSDFEVNESEEEIKEHIRKVVEEGGDTFETKHRTKSGGIRDVMVTSRIVYIRGKKFIQSFWNDITERKRAEEKLEETMEMKAQFISAVSHELRTPLTCMKETIEAVLDGVGGKVTKKQRNFLDIAKRNIDRLAELINDVLDFQKLDLGEMQFNIRENDINEVLEELHKIMASTAENRGVNFCVELNENLPKAVFDEDKIIQLLTNLVSNAIKFTPEQGHVSVNVRDERESLVLSVRDTGMGIPKEALTKIFDRFYRVHRPNKEVPGTGLGLAIVSKIVRAHNGRIEVESEINKGTTFTVFLPLVGGDVAEAVSVEADEVMEETVVN